ncbi:MULTISPECIES: HPP family protein [Streptomyces]|uniref:HPP family protein n=1 Tax=Streptomyces sudanensis TaxID=436397 RepID=A0ABY4TCK1_9ACTN|nr:MULTISPECIES: HPP family protein [Streptomyces]MCP9958945.1 HPP family protein [Streptomyces sudanensis]MCP9988013.1 HPP family protein [Streptomyces sudanensis]MCQ0000578.1 HPP family protein [Streptomyces sudanensis]URN16166.1 HPP family protein [Streptomyces sudanensis]
MSDSQVTALTLPQRFAAALAGKAPARATPAAISVATVGGVVALAVLAAIGVLIDQTVLIPPLAASAALVFAAPALPLAQPRSVIGGQLVSAVVGFAVLAVGGSSVWTAAIAGGLAIGAMALARAPHSPAAATAVIVVLGKPSPVGFLLLLALATLVLVATGIVAGRSGRTARYPTYWW